jgi:predicted membrane-bound spermidine synthase
MSKEKKVIIHTERNIGSKNILLISFIEGFLVMLTELIAIGLISPHYGQGLTVYTFVLGFTMLSLSLGYLFGSYLSNDKNHLNKIIFLLLFYGITLLLMPYISKTLFRSSTSLNLTQSLTLTLPCFIMTPLITIGALSPILINLLSKQESIGLSASKIFTYSTLGGVLGALITGFVFLELFEIEQLIIFVFILLFIFILLLTFRYALNTLKKIAFFVVFFGLIFYFATYKKHFIDPLPNTFKLIYRSDGVLGQIKIIDNLNEKTRSLYTNNTIQTFSMIDGQNVWEYIQRISQYVNFSKGNILLAGLGGGVLVKTIIEKQNSIDIVDIDKRMIDISENFYNIGNDEKVKFYEDDIRHYLRATNRKYDKIILDLSASENVPSHVFTYEAIKELKTKLTKNGCLIIHYFSDFKKSGQKSIDAIGYTVKSAGFSVKLIPTEKKKNELSSIIFVGFINKNDLINQENQQLLPINFKEQIVLTDDKPLLDILRKDMVHFTREEYIKGYKSNWEIIRDLGLN